MDTGGGMGGVLCLDILQRFIRIKKICVCAQCLSAVHVCVSLKSSILFDGEVMPIIPVRISEENICAFFLPGR